MNPAFPRKGNGVERKSGVNRIERKFKELKRQNKKAFVAFITAGYPDLNTTKKLAVEFAKSGVDILELGVPFSDPMADGPVIQEASQAALKNKVNLNNILGMVKGVRKCTQMPICLMTYYNPVFCFGEEKFAKKATEAGVDGVIIPDMPPEEGRSFVLAANKFKLDTIFFLAPTSTAGRMKLISKASKGFIYYVSLMGVTGARKRLPPDIAGNIKKIKRYTDKPVCVGFGVSDHKQVKEIYKVADGVIVGSAIVKKIKENMGRPDLISRVNNFVRSLG